MQVMPILRQLLNLNQLFVIGCLDYLLALRAMIGERYPPPYRKFERFNVRHTNLQGSYRKRLASLNISLLNLR
jgi:hypothetical protein